jgi:hypothetical protein
MRVVVRVVVGVGVIVDVVSVGVAVRCVDVSVVPGVDASVVV